MQPSRRAAAAAKTTGGMPRATAERPGAPRCTGADVHAAAERVARKMSMSSRRSNYKLSISRRLERMQTWTTRPNTPKPCQSVFSRVGLIMSQPLHLTLVAAGMVFGVVLSRGFGTTGEPSSASERSSVITKKRSEHLILKHHAVGRDSSFGFRSCQTTPETWSCIGEGENEFEITVSNEYVIGELMADAKNVFNVQLEEKLLAQLSAEAGRRHHMFGPQEPWKTQSTYFVRSGLRLWLDLSRLTRSRKYGSEPRTRLTAVNNLPAVMDAVSAIGFDLVTSTST